MTTENYQMELTTSGPLLPNFTPEMVQRAEAYATAHAETVRELWGQPFAASIVGNHSRLRLEFPVGVRWTFGDAVTDWVVSGEGDMPDPHQFV